MSNSFQEAPDTTLYSLKACRPLIIVGIETITILISAVLAFLLRFDFSVPAQYRHALVVALIVWVPLKLISFYSFARPGPDQRETQFVSNLIGSGLAMIILLGAKVGVPASVYAIDFLVCLTLTVGLRLAFESNPPRVSRRIRDIAAEDLLCRTPVNLDHEQISAKLRGRTILVTGAAGSVGSEICRQVARFRPAAVVGYDIAESPLFLLGLEMDRDFPSTAFHPEIGNIRNASSLQDVFERHCPSVVYHAAAYKHVPLMESHILEAVENNVFGTANVVEAARRYGVSEFVMISTDKAVRPASVMGATKRLAELLVCSVPPNGGTYLSVRFGNVLGSTGSVVPIFKEQIARGGPVTVTHREMRRYFMTITEACQLVLQASAMGKGSQIFVLNMGEPIKITDLAFNLIQSSGLLPEDDIRIAFTGARPGEKLFEELSAESESLLSTYHEKIQVFDGQGMPRAEIEECLARLRACCRERNCSELVSALRQFVPGYKPSPELMGLLRTDQRLARTSAVGAA